MDISKNWKSRVLGVALSVVLVVGLMPSIALATGGAQQAAEETAPQAQQELQAQAPEQDAGLQDAQLADVTWTQIGDSDCQYKIETDGTEVTLTIAPTDGISGTLPDGYEEAGDWPWDSSRKNITKVVIASGVKAGDSTIYMFTNCRKLESIEGLSGLDTSSVTYMKKMFKGCNVLESIDVSNFDTRNVTDMNGMFYGCNALKSLDLSNFDTSEVTSMADVFCECASLDAEKRKAYIKGLLAKNGGECKDWTVRLFKGCTDKSIDVSDLDTKDATDMTGMFYSCKALKSIEGLSNFDTKNVTDMLAMFSDCPALTSLDLSNFDTSEVTSMRSMFDGCSVLTSLDLSGFNTSNVESMNLMFHGCSGLKTIYVGDKWSTEGLEEPAAAIADAGLQAATGDYGKDMFKDCTSLVGGKGTVYDADHVDATYARIDRGASEPGYLTFKKYGADKTAIQGDGATWTSGSNDALVLSCGGELADCTSIRISGNGIDMQLYDGKSALVEGVTVTEGSTVLTFQPAVLETLSTGTYKVTFSYDEERYDPSTSTATFTVAAAAESAKTGDATILAFAGLAAAAAAAAGLALAATRRRRDL